MTELEDSSLSISLRLTKALGLARQGKIKAAQQLFAPNNAIPNKEIDLHALAALVTHEGDYPRALHLWKVLLQRQPNHPEARRMVAIIELWFSRPSWYRYIPAGAIVIGILAIVGLLAWAL